MTINGTSPAYSGYLYRPVRVPLGILRSRYERPPLVRGERGPGRGGRLQGLPLLSVYLRSPWTFLLLRDLVLWMVD